MTSGKTESCVFFGSGSVAAKCLELLLEHTTIEAVVTKPRPPHHKGSVPVLELATKYNLTVLTASNKKELDKLILTHPFNSRYGILIDFGIIASQNVIHHFELGIINSHFSLLPHLRGADPITWAIANGDEKTGVSLMCIDTGMDTGTLITQKTLHLSPDETTPTLTNKLIQISDQLIREYVPKYLAGDIIPHQQPHPSRATYSRKLTKSDGQIDWNEPAEAIERKIRAFIDWPQSRAQIGGIDVIITAAHVINDLSSAAISEIRHDNSQLLVQTKKGALAIDYLKPAGKKEMPIKAFLAGYKNKL